MKYIYLSMIYIYKIEKEDLFNLFYKLYKQIKNYNIYLIPYVCFILII